MDKKDLLHFRIVDVHEENPYAKTYQLQLLNHPKLNFRPGQFLTFVIQTERQELRRSYSILTLPEEPLKITVKKVENGAISRFILQNWKKGDVVFSLLPAGRFYIEAQPNGPPRDIFCFAAGSGIIPIYPQIRSLLKHEPQSVIHLVYSNRSEKEALFLKDIENTAETFPQLNLIKFFSDPEEQLEFRGRLSNISAEILIQKILKYNKADAVFLTCGPFAYMRMLVFTIGLMGFKKENIKRENYIPSIMYSGTAPAKTFPERDVIVKIDSKIHTVKVFSSESILNAALRSGLNLPFSCKGGVCGNCAAKCKNGKVYMSINEVLTDEDLKRDWILTCTGFPEEEGTEIDFDAE